MNRILSMDIGCRLSIAFYGIWMPTASYKGYTLAGLLFFSEITSVIPMIGMGTAGALILIDCFVNSREPPHRHIEWLKRCRWCLYAIVCFGLITALFAGSRHQEADLSNSFMYFAGAAVCLWAIVCEYRSRKEGHCEAAH